MRTSDVLYVSMVLFCRNVSSDEVNEKNSQFLFFYFSDVGKYRRAESMRINFTI